MQKPERNRAVTGRELDIRDRIAKGLLSPRRALLEYGEENPDEVLEQIYNGKLRYHPTIGDIQTRGDK